MSKTIYLRIQKADLINMSDSARHALGRELADHVAHVGSAAAKKAAKKPVAKPKVKPEKRTRRPVVRNTSTLKKAKAKRKRPARKK